MRISIIIPVYNVKKYLPQCLNSILTQSRKVEEIILIDDGSTDGSAKICDEYAARHAAVTVIHQSNQGVSAARNTGMRHMQRHIPQDEADREIIAGISY